MYEGSVLGFGSVLGRGAVIDKNVLVWPEKTIGEYACVRENVKEKMYEESCLMTTEYTAFLGLSLQRKAVPDWEAQ